MRHLLPQPNPASRQYLDPCGATPEQLADDGRADGIRAMTPLEYFGIEMDRIERIRRDDPGERSPHAKPCLREETRQRFDSLARAAQAASVNVCTLSLWIKLGQAMKHGPYAGMHFRYLTEDERIEWAMEEMEVGT